MALILADRVQESATANTTVSFTLSGANVGYQAFSVIADGSTTYYGATDGTNWEVGIGTYTLSTTTLARTTILSSSNAGAAVSIFTSPVTVFIDYPSSKSVYQSGAFQGTIDNTVIGATTPAAGKFTTLESTGTASLGTASTTYIRAIGDASYPGVYATGGTNTPLVLQPLGTGALQAQKTDSTATGGNARGAYAIDWQLARSAATQVASGYYNILGGGYANTGTASATVTTNTTTIAVSAGTTFYLTATNANIKVGQYITGTGVSGNTYATSTVTTGTPAVMATSTISGTTLTVGSLSSGTIIAGQVLTGTGVTAGTYIVSGSASTWTVSTSQTVSSTTITGTAYTFTISQAATTAAGVTLSFYTPHGVVVGGGNNQATGSYSFIGGGGNAGDSTRRNLASGDWSTVCGGAANTASGGGSSILGGGYDSSSLVFYPNTASGSMATIVGGGQNTSSDFASATIGSYAGTANARVSVVAGGYYGTSRSIVGNFVMSASRQPVSGSSGVSQAALLILGRQTTDATATVLTSDTSAASGTNQVILPNNSAYYFKVRVIAGVTGAGNTKAWTLEGAIKRGSGVGTTAIVGTVTTTIVAADAGAATWTVTATADTTNGGLAITVTGQAATTIRWVAKAETAEMTF